MKPNFALKATVVMLFGAVVTLTPVQGSAPDRVGNMDFTYQIVGDAAARPVQVFDDGKATYFQFRSGENIPAIFADVNGVLGLQLSQAQGPYITIPTVARTYFLRMGARSARVTYMGGQPSSSGQVQSGSPNAAEPARLLAAAGKPQGLPREMFYEQPRVALDVNSYATPIKGDRTEWVKDAANQEHSVFFRVGSSRLDPAGTKTFRVLASSLAGATRIEISGRDDASFKEGLAEARAASLADTLVAVGISRDRITLKRSPVLQTGADKGSVVGATILAVTTRRVEASLPPSGRRDSSDAIVARLQARQITAAEAVQLLEANSMSRAAGGVPARAAPAPAPAKWEIRKTDATLEAMLRRWGKDSGWQVLLKGAPEIRITADQEVKEVEGADFVKAADFVITQARKIGFRIKGSAYSNNVLVLTEEESK
jgi:outer membrane protein OmpA-like peptidoglycan-associated protein